MLLYDMMIYYADHIYTRSWIVRSTTSQMFILVPMAILYARSVSGTNSSLIGR